MTQTLRQREALGKLKPPLEREIVLAILEALQALYPRWCWVRCEPASAVRARAYRSTGGYGRKMGEDAWGDGVADILGIGTTGRESARATRTGPLEWKPDLAPSVAFEVKRPGQKQRPSQVVFQERWEKAGGFYRVVRSVDDAVSALRELEHSP